MGKRPLLLRYLPPNDAERFELQRAKITAIVAAFTANLSPAALPSGNQWERTFPNDKIWLRDQIKFMLNFQQYSQYSMHVD